MRLLSLILIITITFFSQNLRAQETNATSSPDCIRNAHRLVEEAFTLMKQHYYRKDSVQWDELLSSVKTRLNNSSSCAAAQEALEWCFKEMKERHSFVMPARKAEVYNGNINSTGPASLSQLAGPIHSELVEEGIAYIDVPWITTADKTICTAFADSLQHIIADFDQQGVTKWIIDLRNNTGGNCWPMLAGLGPLLGNGIYGYFVSDKEKISISYQDGTVMQGRYARCTTSNPYTLKTTPSNIIVLTGPNTASAGEIVAIAFKGQKNVLLYGEPTAGLTTANATYKLSDGSLLVLTVCKEADRYGNIIEGRIQPNVLIKPSYGGDAVKSRALMTLELE